MGDNIQHLSPPPGIRLHDSPSISGPKRKGGCVTNHMNEHKVLFMSLIVWYNASGVLGEN